jgi:pantoate--beta-alanine ligase
MFFTFNRRFFNFNTYICTPMEVYNKISDLQAKLDVVKEKAGVIGFVPTMGALHKGHLSLVEQSVSENTVTVVSIFVNPTQFNDKNDLINYPRNLEQDIELLTPYNCIIFAPDEKEIYPEKDTREFELGGMDTLMEGKFRPGHFNGVAQVVTRLFEIVRPNRAYFGIKDFQQVAVIKYIVRKNRIPVEVISCPIVREDDGLAMSSRNMRLSPYERNIATAISKTILFIKDQLSSFSEYDDIKKYVLNELGKIPGLKTEYFEIVDEESLLEIQSIKSNNTKVACIAVWIGNVRLIDNVKLNS